MSTWTARTHELHTAQAAQLAEILTDVDLNAPELDSRKKGRAGSTARGDPSRLRGIPAIGRSVTGAIPGTSPHAIR